MTVDIHRPTYQIGLDVVSETLPEHFENCKIGTRFENDFDQCSESKPCGQEKLKTIELLPNDLFLILD